MSGKKIIKTEEITSVKTSADSAQNKGNSYVNSEVVNLNKNNIMESKTIRSDFSKFNNFATTKSVPTKASTYESEITDFERLSRLCKEDKKEGVKLRLTPRSQPTHKCNYTWVYIKIGKTEHKFKLTLNEDIFQVLMTYVMTGIWEDKEINISEGVEEFHELHQNFPLSLMQFEHAMGQAFCFVKNECFSKYKFGMIIYQTYNNADLRHFIETIW